MEIKLVGADFSVLLIAYLNAPPDWLQQCITITIHDSSADRISIIERCIMPLPS